MKRGATTPLMPGTPYSKTSRTSRKGQLGAKLETAIKKRKEHRSKLTKDDSAQLAEVLAIPSAQNGEVGCPPPQTPV